MNSIIQLNTKFPVTPSLDARQRLHTHKGPHKPACPIRLGMHTWKAGGDVRTPLNRTSVKIGGCMDPLDQQLGAGCGWRASPPPLAAPCLGPGSPSQSCFFSQSDRPTPSSASSGKPPRPSHEGDQTVHLRKCPSHSFNECISAFSLLGLAAPGPPPLWLPT